MGALTTAIEGMLGDATAAAVAMAVVGVTVGVIALVKRRA